MSHQVNLSHKDLTTAYQDVVNGSGIDWAIFTYDKATNDLKVQATGDGGLEELQEEFSDGRCVQMNAILSDVDGVSRMQYAFVRVQDPNVGSRL